MTAFSISFLVAIGLALALGAIGVIPLKTDPCEGKRGQTIERLHMKGEPARHIRC